VTDRLEADQDDLGERDSAAAADRLRRAEATASKSFFELVPRKDLVKVVLLLVFLVVVIALQRRSGAIIDSLTRGLSPAPAVPTRSGEPPRVRLAPPAAPGTP
jgi:hypothetical protein